MNNRNGSQVFINRMTSNINVVDARSMLSPDALTIIRDEIRKQIEQYEREKHQRESLTRIDRRAVDLD
jgi:hypothetical protein